MHKLEAANTDLILITSHDAGRTDLRDNIRYKNKENDKLGE